MTQVEFYRWEVTLLLACLKQALGAEHFDALQADLSKVPPNDTDNPWLYCLFALDGYEPARDPLPEAWHVGQRFLERVGPAWPPLTAAHYVGAAWPPDPTLESERQFEDDVDELSEAWRVLAPLAADAGIAEPDWLIDLFLSENPARAIRSMVAP